MIRVRKPSAPVELYNGAHQTERDCIKYNSNKDDYSNGRKVFRFDRNIYSHKAVKKALREAQHRKCCYCEWRFGASFWGSIEHYRPKGSVRQDNNSAELTPGYYWLAYTWANLYWCCPSCNQKKDNFFPLANPEKRARSHHDEINSEDPLIVDPGGFDDPELHIWFDEDLAVSKSEKGQATIHFVNLNREDLEEERRRRLNRARRCGDIIQLADSGQLDNGLRKVAIEELRNWAKPAARFSAMITIFVREQLSCKTVKEILG